MQPSATNMLCNHHARTLFKENLRPAHLGLAHELRKGVAAEGPLNKNANHARTSAWLMSCAKESPQSAP